MKAANLHKVGSADIYCGRETSWKSEYGSDCSQLGNPFPMKNGVTRKEVLVQYERYLQDNMNFFMEAIWSFIQYEKQLKREITLGCFCKPHDCHVDILIKYASIAQYWRPPRVKDVPKRVILHGISDSVVYNALINALQHQLDERETVKQYGDKSVAVELVFNELLRANQWIEGLKQQEMLKAQIWQVCAEIETDDYR